MGIKLNTALKALTMLLVCNFCRSSNETLQIDTLFLLDRKEINHNFEFKDIDRNSIEDLIFQRIEKRSLNYTKDDKDLVNIESNYTDLVSKMKKGKVSSNNSEIHFGKILSFEEDDSSYVDAYNFTEEPCVGDPEFCNMTRDEYLDMLNDYIFPQPYEWVLITAHAIVFVIGLIGNALVCIAVYRNHSMRTVTNYFIVNLAVADFMVILICLPPTVLWDVTETWFFGTAMCRIVLYFQSVSVTVSVLTLTFISVDRWYAICFPLRFKSTTGRAKTAILIIWCLSLTFNIPEFVVLQVQRKMQLRFNVQYFMQCTSTWSGDSDLKWHIIKALFLYTFHSTSRMLTILRRDNLLLYQVIVLFSLGVSFSLARLYLKTSFVFLPRPIDTTYNSRFPLFLMMVAYCQIVRVLWRSDNIPGHTESHKLCNPPTGTNNWLAANRRATPSIHANASTEGQLRSRRKAAKMLVAVVVMFAVCYFPVHLLSVLRLAYDVQQSDIMTCIALISHVMCYANSAVNPLIYNFMSGKFRREFHKSYFKCFCCCHPAASQDQNRTSFAPIGSSRAGTTRTIVRRNDSCVSYRLTHLSPSNQNNIYRDYARNTNTSFIENLNGNKRPKKGDDSLSESATRFTIATDAGKE